MSIFNYNQQKNSGYFSRLGEALKSTKEDLAWKLQQVSGTAESRISEDQLEDIEEILIGADIGVATASEIIDLIKEETKASKFITLSQCRRIIRQKLYGILISPGRGTERDLTGADTPGPRVILVVGVNGVGKTTTIGKLASLYKKQGKSVLMCASDTFRAAAVEQIDIWASRAGCDIVKQAGGADPAAVLFDALSAAKSRGVDYLIADTAGRLHNKENLMQELEKMCRIAGREIPGAPHEIFLVLDATTGQNGLQQAREFSRMTGLSGVIITKLDGTAKGGIIVSIVKELDIPVRYIGVGEQLEDLLEFDPEPFLESIIESDS